MGDTADEKTAQVEQEPKVVPCSHIAYDKEGKGDKVTKPGAPRTAKSFGEPPWAT